MSQKLVIKIKGLQTNQNQLSEVSDGALTLAKNINIDKDSVAESRRGYGRILNPPASSAARHDRSTSYQGKLIARRSDNNTLNYYVDGVGWTALSGTYSHPDANLARMRFVQSSGNLYFTTSEGVKVLDVYSGPVYQTGMPKGLDGSGATTGASGFMTNNTQVAYRVLWGSRDANSNLYLGAPSQRIIVANSSGGTRDVSLTITIPVGITTSDFFQVYRSKESASSTDEPNDELQLVYEKNPTAGEITAKSVTFTDSTPVSLMGASLYSNASQEGIQKSNDAPPLCQDIALFKNFMFFGNVSTKHKISIKLLSAGGSGLALNDTITINSVVYTAKAAETIASREFKLSTGGSAAQNIDDTARSLVKVINQYASNTTIYAYYTSGFQDLPGQITLEARTLSGSSFSVAVSRAVAWDIGTGNSSNESYQNGLMWSKIQQNEHVPTAHLELVGSKNYPIRRIVALRDSLFILKADGVFRLTGNNGSWSVDPLDTSTKIIAPDSAAVVNNQIFALTDQGICSISDIGVQVISRPIENLLQDLISLNYDSLKYKSFGISYDTDRKYILPVITNAGDLYCTQAFVYNTFTQAWTTWNKDIDHAFVNEVDDKLYICNPTDKHILQERKNLDYTDFIDEEVDGFSVVSSSGNDVVLNATAGIDTGYLLFESSTKYAVVTAVTPASNTVTVSNSISWSVGAISVFKSINCEIEYASIHCDNPGVMKHYQEMAILFREKNFITGTASFYTDLSGGYSLTTINGNFGGASWGSFLWGEAPWGGIIRPKPTRIFIPREKSRGSLLSFKLEMADAYSKWSLNGISLQFDYVSERSSRT